MITSKTFLFILLLVPLALLAGMHVIVPLFAELGAPPEGHGTMDSVALYVAADPSQSLVFVTDKDESYVEMHNPVTRQYVGRIGGAGDEAGKLLYPNGVGVAYGVQTGSGKKDLLFVVERDNHRVSVFSLPDKNFIAHFGASALEQPYGIACYWKGNELQAWITETEPSPDRVYVYRILPEGAGVKGVLALQFETAGYLESIVIDPVAQRALICDEGDGHDVMVYDLQGNLITRFGNGLFVDEPEGLALYDLGNGAGYIIVSDQNAEPTEYEVFDRKTYQALGHFSGPTTTTDGLTLTQAALPNLPSGSFYAMHSDDVVHIYDWAEIATAMNLQTRVISPRTAVAEMRAETPRDFEVLSNYPNPFSVSGAFGNPSTTIRYQVDRLVPVQLEIFTLTGERVRRLVNAEQAPGQYRVAWNAQSDHGQRVATGVYWMKLRVGEVVHLRKALLVK
ncbi:hypothetical protein HUU05_19900 [candidate division KSB1 bacterium]|nr:hypothetical protein [candidate division KSB1 bacterium]